MKVVQSAIRKQVCCGNYRRPGQLTEPKCKPRWRKPGRQWDVVDTVRKQSAKEADCSEEQGVFMEQEPGEYNGAE